MALENELVLDWTARGFTGVLNIENSPEEFDDTKEEYNLTVTIANEAGQEQIFVYKVTNQLEHLPALCVIGYQNINSLTPGSCYYFSTNALDQAIICPKVRLLNITGNIDFELVSASGVGNYSASRVLHGGAYCIDIDGDIYSIATDTSVSINIEADFPLFMGTETDYDDTPNVVAKLYNYDASVQGVYISEIALAGDLTNISEAINGYDATNEIPQNKIYFIRNILKCDGSVVAHKHYRFRIPPNGKLCLVATEHDNTGLSYNMKLKGSGMGLPVNVFLYMDMEDNNPTWQESHSFTSALSDYFYGDWTDFGSGSFYKVVGMSKAGNTNIPIFANDTQAQEYFDGLRGEDTAMNSGELGVGGNVTTGDSLESSDIPNPVIAGSGAGCNVWLLDSGNLHSIFNDLYDDTQSIIDDIKKGTWQWGNNPIDFIISIYYVPFDVSNFYDTQTKRVILGQYDTGHDYTCAKETKSSGQRIVLVNQTIDNVYGDFRDLDFFKYELFLPYVGFVPLNPAIYVGHTLKVEMGFNVMTHNIRYYLFVDGVITDRVDGSVGYDIPITGTDMVNKAQNNINGLKDMITGGAEGIAGAGKSATDVTATGSLGVVAGIDKVMGGALKMAQYPRTIIRGDISASMNIYDINYVYLKITEKQSIYPPEITQIYNFPSYVAGALSQLSGYCEISNIQLKSNCTESEYNEIIELLKGGVIF